MGSCFGKVDDVRSAVVVPTHTCAIEEDARRMAIDAIIIKAHEEARSRLQQDKSTLQQDKSTLLRKNKTLKARLEDLELKAALLVEKNLKIIAGLQKQNTNLRSKCDILLEDKRGYWTV
jgi:hypothetical protein